MVEALKFLTFLVATLAMAILPTPRSQANSAFDFVFKGIDGSELPLSQWKGRPVLVVNTASRCGFTPQYTDLQTVWAKYRDRGLVVLGVPSNDFGGQEPGTAAQIKEFCETNFDIDFPMTEKYVVSGQDAHPFFRFVVDQLGSVNAPRWNFYKYLVAPDGHIVGAWSSTTKPTSPAIAAKIEELLDR